MLSKKPFPKEWSKALNPYLKTKAWNTLLDFVDKEYSTTTVYPNKGDLFKAFDLTPLSQIKVVILGQDPYHGAGQAQGLSFSVPNDVALPPSLKNIYKEIESDLGVQKDLKKGSLEALAQQGVFLLNSVLSVIENTPTSHRGRGWEEFTDHVIKTISSQNNNVVFMLWGNFAKSKKSLIHTSKHLVLESSHPSPFSAYSGFFGTKQFSKCNDYLKEHNKKEINW